MRDFIAKIPINHNHDKSPVCVRVCVINCVGKVTIVKDCDKAPTHVIKITHFHK